MRGMKEIVLAMLMASIAGTALAGKRHEKEDHDADRRHAKPAVERVRGELSVMVLGSGGPIAVAEGRASAGYLIFTDGRPRILMDVGGGTYQRLAQSGVNIKDLDIVLLSHLHADHTGDLTSVIKTIYFHNNRARNAARRQGVELPGRTAPIHIYGPAASPLPPGPGITYPNGATVYPSTVDYVDGHFGLDGGVERYLKAFVSGISDDDGPMGPGGSVSNFAYVAHDLSSRVPFARVETVLEADDGLVVKAIAVDHGPVPAVAFRIEYKGHSIVYSGDTGTKGRGPRRLGQSNMATLSQGADMLIYDTAIMEAGDEPANPLFHILHTEPSLIGGVAVAAGVRRLLLSHITPVTGPRLDEVKHIIRDTGYRGRIGVARDLAVYNLGRPD